MSLQDLDVALDDLVLCPECGDVLDGDNVSIEGFEHTGGLICVDCFDPDEVDE